MAIEDQMPLEKLVRIWGECQQIIEDYYNANKKLIERHIQKNLDNVPLKELLEFFDLPELKERRFRDLMKQHEEIPRFLKAVRLLLFGSELDENNTLSEILTSERKEYEKALAELRSKGMKI